MASDVITSYSIALGIQFLLYGSYAVLLALCLHVMSHQRRRNMFHLTTMISLFVLASLGLVFGTAEMILEAKMYFLLVVRPNTILAMQAMVLVVYTLANIIADALLLHHCYIIWSRNKKVLVPLIILSVINNAFALVAITTAIISNKTEGLSAKTILKLSVTGSLALILFLTVNILTNLLIPFMIAGRIWWIRRRVAAILTSHEDKNNYNIALCLESGLIYPLALIPCLLLYILPHTGDVPTLFPVLIQVVCIAPTLVIVRSTLGTTIENVQDTLRSARNSAGRGRAILTTFDSKANEEGRDEEILLR